LTLRPAYGGPTRVPCWLRVPGRAPAVSNPELGCTRLHFLNSGLHDIRLPYASNRHDNATRLQRLAPRSYIVELHTVPISNTTVTYAEPLDVAATLRPRLQHAMPICIECRHPVKTLWTKYSNADDKSSGHNIRLTVCRNCGHFCDKYVEHDFVVLFIDLVLIKPQVYRHLLHNTLMKDDDRFDSSIVRLGVLLLLFDVYLTWARIEKQTVPTSARDEGANLGSLTQQSIVSQYLFFLILCALSTLAFHTSIRFMTSSVFSPLSMLNVLPRYSRPNSVSTALLVSSSTKLFPILMVIWQYDVPAAARSLGWAVVANNVEALRILLDCGYGVATLLATTGALARWAVGRSVLWAAGLDGVDSIGETSIAADGKALWALLMYVREWASDLAAG
ncbi:arv1-like family protein, partial [Colletotrichum incanum]